MILYKVIYVPITHDETATAVYYCKFNILQLLFYIDIGDSPNNHILNTLFTKLAVSFFGIEQWVIRLPNLLSFIVYSIGVFRVIKTVIKEDSVYFIPCSLIFVSHPYMLDFFGLCRGYGMSCAFAVLSVSFLISGYKFLNNRHIWVALLLSLLASYANFTLLVFWLGTALMCWFYFTLQLNGKLKKLIKPTIIIVLINIIFLGLIAYPIYRMQSTNQFQYWSSNGFYDQTIIPLLIFWLPEFNFNSATYINLFAFFIFATIGIGVSISFIKFKWSGYKLQSLATPLFATSILVLSTSIINIIQCWVLKSPNLVGRTALFFVPLFICALVGLIGLLSTKHFRFAHIIISSVLCFSISFHFINTLNLRSVREWWFDSNTLEVLDFLEKTDHREKISLKTNWLFHPSFYFYNYAGKSPRLELFEIDHNIDSNTTADYYYVFADDYQLLKSRYEIEQKFSDDRWLLSKRP